MQNTQPTFIKDLGMRYPTSTSKYKARYGVYLCPICNKEFEALTPNIKSGYTKSCGCSYNRLTNTHGQVKHRLYHTWNTMKQRCYNIKNKAYLNYGGRGIKVCDRWLDINNFIEDMYPSFQEGLSLDRIDVNGDYEPDNCRWVVKNTQSRNTRDICSTNTSGYRGVCFNKKANKWVAHIGINAKLKYLGLFETPLEAAKAYETYVRQNNLEHNFTPVLTDEEILALSFDKD